jgi:hypothetical protein
LTRECDPAPLGNEAGAPQLFDQFLFETRKVCYRVSVVGKRPPLLDGVSARGRNQGKKSQRKCLQDALAHNLRRELKADKIFIWIRRNPLKSPESAKGIQGNPSFFAWFYLVLLGFIWTKFARWLNS